MLIFCCHVNDNVIGFWVNKSILNGFTRFIITIITRRFLFKLIIKNSEEHKNEHNYIHLTAIILNEIRK